MNAPLAQGYEARIGTAGLFWGLLWRTGFSGLVFGATLIAVFGAALPAPSGTGHLDLRGVLFGTVAGAIEGSVLGALCGLLSFTTTRAFYLPVPADVRDYLTTTRATCALAAQAIGGHAEAMLAGLYATCGLPRAVFQGRLPDARGSATTISRPENRPDGSFALVSDGRRFGKAGYYRVDAPRAPRCASSACRWRRPYTPSWIPRARSTPDTRSPSGGPASSPSTTASRHS